MSSQVTLYRETYAAMREEHVTARASKLREIERLMQLTQELRGVISQQGKLIAEAHIATEQAQDELRALEERIGPQIARATEKTLAAQKAARTRREELMSSEQPRAKDCYESFIRGHIATKTQRIEQQRFLKSDFQPSELLCDFAFENWSLEAIGLSFVERGEGSLRCVCRGRSESLSGVMTKIFLEKGSYQFWVRGKVSDKTVALHYVGRGDEKLVWGALHPETAAPLNQNNWRDAVVRFTVQEAGMYDAGVLFYDGALGHVFELQWLKLEKYPYNKTCISESFFDGHCHGVRPLNGTRVQLDLQGGSDMLCTSDGEGAMAGQLTLEGNKHYKLQVVGESEKAFLYVEDSMLEFLANPLVSLGSSYQMRLAERSAPTILYFTTPPGKKEYRVGVVFTNSCRLRSMFCNPVVNSPIGLLFDFRSGCRHGVTHREGTKISLDRHTLLCGPQKGSRSAAIDFEVDLASGENELVLCGRSVKGMAWCKIHKAGALIAELPLPQKVSAKIQLQFTIAEPSDTVATYQVQVVSEGDGFCLDYIALSPLLQEAHTKLAGRPMRVHHYQPIGGYFDFSLETNHGFLCSAEKRSLIVAQGLLYRSSHLQPATIGRVVYLIAGRKHKLQLRAKAAVADKVLLCASLPNVYCNLIGDSFVDCEKKIVEAIFEVPDSEKPIIPVFVGVRSDEMPWVDLFEMSVFPIEPEYTEKTPYLGIFPVRHTRLEEN